MLKMILTTLDGLSDDVKKEYVERDGKFQLSVEGAKSQIDIDKLMQAAANERLISKDLKAKLELWGERNPEESIALLDTVPELQAAAEAGKKKLDTSQIDAIVNGRLAPIQRDLDKTKADYAKAQETIAERDRAERRRQIHDQVRSAASEAGVLPSTYTNELGALMLLADSVFTVDDNKAVVVKDNVPGILHGIGLKDALPMILQAHPYLLAPSQGGGATGSTTTSGGTENPFKGNNMTARSEFVAANQSKPGVVERAMKDAGLTNPAQKYVGK